MTTSPIPQAHGVAARVLRAGRTGLECEANEVADFFDEVAERIAGSVPRLRPELLRAGARTLTAVQERAHVHDGKFGPRRGRRGDRG